MVGRRRVVLRAFARDPRRSCRASAGGDTYAECTRGGNHGSEFPVEVSLGPLKSPEGILLSSAIRDITDRKRVVNELRHSREQLAEAERVARTGSLEWDLSSGHAT